MKSFINTEEQEPMPDLDPRRTHPPANILLVEDNPADAELARMSLEDGRHVGAVHCVADAEGAIDFLERRDPFQAVPRPDIILLDLNLPGMSGHDLLRIVKSDPRFQSIPAVILSTSDSGHEIAGAYASLANAYLVKPLDFSSFASLMADFRRFWFELVRLPA